jgi:hypothetical protein
MKKLLFVLLLAVLSHSSFAQPAKSKSVTDCNELKFWFKELQAEFKNLQPTANGDLNIKRMFKGFDTTEHQIYGDGSRFSITGVAFRFKNKQATRTMFKKLVALIKSCEPNMKPENKIQDEISGGYAYFNKNLSKEKYISIELKWYIHGEDGDTFQNLYCMILFNKNSNQPNKWD